MDKKSRNTIIISIVALAIVLITVTYAYFSARITGIESASTISLTAGRMEIVYSEGNEILSFSNIYPREEAWVTKSFTLTGYNTTAIDMTYDLGIDITSNTFPDNYLTYDLTLVSSTNGTPIATKTGYPLNGIGNKRLGTGTFTNANGDTHNYELKIYFKDNGLDQNDAQDAIFNASLYVSEVLDAPDGWRSAPAGTLLAGIKSNHSKVDTILSPESAARDALCKMSDVLITSKLDLVGAYQTYQEYYWTYADSVEQLANGKFKLVNPQTCIYSSCYSSLVGKYLVSSDPASGANTTGDAIISENNHIIMVVSATASSFTYKEANSLDTTERIMAATLDDYGTSYYFRGLVDDNYVQFANMCWRIVRITGDGSIKLVLSNSNPDNVANPCQNGYEQFERSLVSSSYYYVNFFNGTNNSVNYPCRISFTYGNCGPVNSTNSYENTFNHTQNSISLNNLDRWYNEKIIQYDDKIADVIWCNDKSTPDGFAPEKHFGAYLRRGNPSLICPDSSSENLIYKDISRYTKTKDSYGGNGILNNKIGMLTADEIIFAGNGNYSQTFINYYSTPSGKADHWYTLSPVSISSNSRATIYTMSKYLQAYTPNNMFTGVRPAIALKSNVTISGGNGTASNPFVVN